MNSFRIGGVEIGPGLPPFIIAEMSGNHNGSLERALEIVKAAAESGVHAIKLQTYTADTMTIDIKENEFLINDETSLWNGRTLYDLYTQASTPWEWHEPIFNLARDLGLIAFSTPFDSTAVDFLEGLDVPCYKIASFENTDHELIRRVAETGKPLIISTGMATIRELAESVEVARKSGVTKLVLLKCTSSYPAQPRDSNLATIPHMRALFDAHIGLSDHTLGIGVSVAAAALGACVIEKHITLDRNDGAVDSAFSMEPFEMQMLRNASVEAVASIGKVSYGFTSSENLSQTHRRSLYVVKDIESGEIISTQNVRAIRPGLGLPVADFPRILGRKARESIKRGTPLSWDLI